jgi:imidazolonepropionase-like amidohydrolase
MRVLPAFPYPEDTVPTKIVDGYEVEFTGEVLEGTGQWGAYVSIHAPSANPMHLTVIAAKRRVAADLTLLDQHAAEAEAERAAMAMLDGLRS